MSSTQFPTCENSSLTSVPDSPYFWNSNGEPKILLPMLKTVVGVSIGIGWPWFLLRRGFGSKVSICDGPPSMNRNMTDFALGAK